MSEQSIVALVALVASAVIGVASLGFNFWNSTNDRKQRLAELRAEHDERYRIGLYEKRLEIYQKAFTWSQNLGRSAFFIASRNGDPDQLGRGLDDFRVWLDSVNLYLDPGSYHELSRLLQRGRQVVLREITYSEFTQDVETTQKALVTGIALKHIDFDASRHDLQEMREQPRDR